MNDQQLLRYSRQIMLPQMDIAGQETLLAAKVLIIGLGGLGCPAAIYLASAGVGHLTLADGDNVELSNLQRQIAHNTNSIGTAKVNSAQNHLNQLNPDTQISTIEKKLAGDDLHQAIANHDVIVDCTDNIQTRFAINRASIKSKKPVVCGAAIRMDGQLSIFDHRLEDSPCYECLYGENTEQNLSCSESGVMAPIVGIIGTMQAMETIKLITGIGTTLQGKLLLLDAMTMQWREMKLSKDKSCKACSKQ